LNKLIYIAPVLLILLIFASCKNQKNNGVTDIAVAEVAGHTLYISEVLRLEIPEKSKEDSLAFVDSYIEEWVKNRLFLNKAEEYLPENQYSIEQQVADYKTSLMTYLYEKQLIRQNLDIKVSDNIIENYYETYKENFILKETVLRPRLVILPNDYERIDSVKAWIKSEEPYFKEAFKNVTRQSGNKYYDGSDWFNRDDFLLDLPEGKVSERELMRVGGLKSFKYDDKQFILYTVEIGIKDSIAPLDYKKQDIEKIIVNKRKNDYLKKTKERIYNEAVSNKDFEIYDLDQ